MHDTKQPKWELIANLGDVNPLEYGGYFVYRDTTGVYPPEAELLVEPCEGESKYTIYRFILEPCTFVDGVLSDNKFHPDYPAWFATPEAQKAERPQDTTYLSRICETHGIDRDELIKSFCSEDPIDRAHAWRMVGEYHGFENLDQSPASMSKAEVRKRYRQGELGE